MLATLDKIDLRRLLVFKLKLSSGIELHTSNLTPAGFDKFVLLV